MRDTFASPTYPHDDFRGLHVSHEYPLQRQDYPGIWVDMRINSLRTAGLGHYEVIENAQGNLKSVHRWRFTGIAEFTMAAMTSLERARLFDEAIKVLVHGEHDTQRGIFRDTIHSNGLIRMSMDFDDLNTGGFAATPGTPWGTQDIIYETTISQDVAGEFLSDPSTDSLVPLDAIHVTDRIQEFPEVERTTIFNEPALTPYDPTAPSLDPQPGPEPGEWQ